MYNPDSCIIFANMRAEVEDIYFRLCNRLRCRKLQLHDGQLQQLLNLLQFMPHCGYYLRDSRRGGGRYRRDSDYGLDQHGRDLKRQRPTGVEFMPFPGFHQRNRRTGQSGPTGTTNTMNIRFPFRLPREDGCSAGGKRQQTRCTSCQYSQAAADSLKHCKSFTASDDSVC